MCVMCNFFPLYEDRILKTRRIVFGRQFNLFEVEDIQSLSKNAKFLKIKELFGEKLPSISPHEEFVKFVMVPCGKCSECLNAIAREKMIRILLECKEHKYNYFVTFTYDDEHCPQFLIKDEISKFNKKLKTYLKRNNLKSDFRFYAVGEYGSKTLRPHYHVIYFGLEIPDLKYYSSNENSQILYNSEFLSDVWSKGHVVIGEVDAGSAAYVARYCEKKQRGSKDISKIKDVFPDFVPEFSNSSRNPGIGANAFDMLCKKFSNGEFNLFLNSNKFSIPKYFKDKFKKIYEFSPELLLYESYANFQQSLSMSKKILSYGKKYLSTLKHNDDIKLLMKKERRN